MSQLEVSGQRAIYMLLFMVAPALFRTGLADEPSSGWRGNRTGLWPDASPPVEWQRIPHGAIEGMRGRSDTPPAEGHDGAAVIEKGLLRDWLVTGPFAVADSVQDFEKDLLDGEAKVAPGEGDKTADRVWRRVEVPPDDPMIFGNAELPWLDLAKAVGFQRNQLAYAHTYLFTPRGGPARIVVQHGAGLKAWLNGREVYRQPQRMMTLGTYVQISNHELKHLHHPTPCIDVELNPGWNRLLLKLSTSNREDWTDMRCSLRIIDPPHVSYASRNILWMTELPGRSTSTPIMVGDRVFLMAEPDEIVCLDKQSGRILWRAANNFYTALTPAERQANPAYASRIEPLVAGLNRTSDRVGRIELRAKIQQAFVEIDEPRFRITANDHFEAHFGIVGFTMPTPVSDGKYVYAWCNSGIAACYDLDGNRQWITRLETDHLSYGSSPALADGVVAVFLNELVGLDARTGEIRWRQHRVHKNIAAILAARLADQNVFITQPGEVIRPSDGKLLFRPRGITSGDQGWSPPVILDNTMYLQRYGVNELNIFDFTDCEGDEWQPKQVATIGLPGEVSRKPDGGWIDRWTAGSPLVWQGLLYQVDIYGNLYVVDLASRQMIYRRELNMRGLMHYNAVPVAASPTLIGRHIFVMDNQGTTLVLEPGTEFKVIARNQLDTQLERDWPIPAQETLAYAPPIADGSRLYLRGERYLYCISEEEP